MQKVQIFDIQGMELPAGRRTRVILGENGAINGEHFCQGYVVIYPGGSIPAHQHENVESYTILRGEGEMRVAQEAEAVKEGDCVYIPSGLAHELRNTGSADMHMMFVYSPKTVVDHWAQELSSES